MTHRHLALINEIIRKTGLPLNTPARGITPGRTIVLHLRNNPDGSLKWIWPSGLSEPLFLKFYNTSTRRSTLIAAVIKLFFVCRLQRLFASASVKVIVDPLQYETFIKKFGKQWALFAGTPGVSQTAVMYADGYYYKIPVGKDAAYQLQHEFRQHEQWKNYGFKNIEMAGAVYDNGILCQKDISGKGKNKASLATQHWLALRELSAIRNCSFALHVLPQWKELDERLEKLHQLNDKRIPAGFIQKLKLLKGSINASAIITAHFSHGDFTPWNMYVKTNRIALVDWEMAETTAPALFDAFHFLYQQASLADHISYRKLKKKISEAFENIFAQEIIKNNETDVFLHEQLYVLFTAVYYTEKYSGQEHWHRQVKWSFEIWNEALSEMLLQKNIIPPRQLLLTDIFSHLHTSNYAALKWIYGAPSTLPHASDVDICIEKKYLQSFTHFLSGHPLVSSIRVHKKSFMHNYEIILADNSLISIDTIWQFKRRGLVIMDAASLLSSVMYNEFGIRVPQTEQDLLYIRLFYLLNNADVPEKYLKHYHAYLQSFQKYFDRAFMNRNKSSDGVEKLFQFNQQIKNDVIKILKKMPQNKAFHFIKNHLQYLADTVREGLSRKGFIITFSGVDGAGKSTVIENIKQQIEKKYRRRVVVLRHRPAVLPMLAAWKEGRGNAEKNAAMRMPRQGNNKGFLSSLFRFAYYYADYIIGQLAVQFRYVWRGYVVLYDRYYFDFISDSRRSNIDLPQWFTGFWYSLLIKPSYNFFLYADENIILKRKQELDGDTIRMLTKSYMRLFSSFNKRFCRSKYIAINNDALPHTLQTIECHIKDKMLCEQF